MTRSLLWSTYFSLHSKLFQCLLAVGLLLIELSATAFAAITPEQISFQNVLENKDIALGEGASLLQDSDGFMWLGGANMLIRYDGVEFRRIDISTNPDNPNEKSAVNFSESIFEDSHHTIWVASRGGLLRYDRNIEKLIRIKDDDTQTAKISTAGHLRMAELPSGELLVAGNSGLYIVDPTTFKYTFITADKSKPDGLKSARINAIFVENQNTIWLGTEAGLEKLDWKTKAFSFYSPNPEKPNVLLDNRVLDIVSDREGQLWVGTQNGLVHFDPKTGAVKRYQHDPADRFSLGSNDIWDLMLDSQGALWISTDGGGVIVFDKETNRFFTHTYEPGRVGSLSSTRARTTYEDKNGDVWIGTYPAGINFFDRSSAAITSYARDIANPNSLSYTAVQSVSEDQNGNLWVGTDGGGLNYFDREKNQFKHFLSDPNDPTTLSGNAVLTNYVDSNGLIWTGSWGAGMSSYNPETNKFTRYPFDTNRQSTTRVSTSERLNSAPVWSIIEDKFHDMWIGTHTGGLSKYNPKTKLFTHYTTVTGDPESISANLVWSILEDVNGNLWVGTTSGLNLFDRTKETFTRFTANPEVAGSLSNNSCLSLFEDSKKRLWVGTDAGLNLFDPKTKSFTVFDKKSGFINDGIRQILEDAAGNIWVSTNNGMASLDPETKKIKIYNRIGGRLVGGFATHAGVVTQKGEIVFGGTEGLRIINPSELSENKLAPPVALTDFKIFSDSIAVGGPDGILPTSINHSEKIVLDYTKSMFVFEFSSLNFRDSNKNKYSYKLEGFDKDWLDAGNQRTAKYTNLNAGKYVFKVKGSNNDGVWNNEGKSITIIQLPPPWKTWWAYTIYTLIVLSLFAWFIYSQRRKRQLIEEQNRILEIRVAERTAEVRQKSNDIQAMLTNMPQGLFTVQANGKIHPEYSHYLESIFDTTDIAEREASDLLFTGANIGSDALDSAKAAIFAIIGEDEMNFDFNKSLLLSEFDSQISGKQKYLSLDWNPIIVDDVVNKLMVSVRDVTQLKVMESAAKEQKRQLDIISQLLNLSADKYLGFEESASKYIASNRAAIESSTGYDEKVIGLLFRNMHTIKGNCRTFGFTHLSNTVHEVESSYTALKEVSEPTWDTSTLLEDLDLVEKGLAEYGHVYRSVLGRGKSKSTRNDGFWMSSAVMSRIEPYIEQKGLEALKTYVNQLNAVSIEKNLEDAITSLESIAAQLDKPTPVVVVESGKIRIPSQAQALITDVFSHILRNSLDHGIESPEERVAAGKNAEGLIQIRTEVERDKLNISIEDDGKGLNTRALFNKGVNLARWKEDDKPSVSDIAKLIFESGVSTKDDITTISGRGVGMDAVKQFLVEKGGDVAIELHNEKATQENFVPFTLVVTLPAELFFVAPEDSEQKK